MIEFLHSHALMPLMPAQVAPDSVIDPTGILIALAVLGALGVAAWALVRSKPARPLPPEVEEEEREEKRPVAGEPGDQARAAAKALRRAARGGVKIGADGEARRIEAFDEATRREAAEDLRRTPAERARREAVEDLTRRAPARPAEAVAEQEQRAYLQAGLSKTRSEGFVARLGKLFAGKQIDDALLDQIEEVLYRADLGVKTADSLLKALKTASSRRELEDPEHVWRTLRHKSLELLKSVDSKPITASVASGPAVVMVVGVNGSGKTTTIGKLAHRYAGEGKKVLVAAADTFRAAAVDQLEVWCNRAGVELFRGKDGADPASVCYGAIEQARQTGVDLVIVDTAGRLHTNSNLMEELSKVGRVAAKAQPGAPHEVLLVLDATMGQNAVKQAELFRDAIEVTGIALTKLDGTAKGGVVLAIAEALKLPVKLVGVGEKMQDLRDFDPDLFIEMLFEHSETVPASVS